MNTKRVFLAVMLIIVMVLLPTVSHAQSESPQEVTGTESYIGEPRFTTETISDATQYYGRYTQGELLGIFTFPILDWGDDAREYEMYAVRVFMVIGNNGVVGAASPNRMPDRFFHDGAMFHQEQTQIHLKDWMLGSQFGERVRLLGFGDELDTINILVTNSQGVEGGIGMNVISNPGLSYELWTDAHTEIFPSPIWGSEVEWKKLTVYHDHEISHHRRDKHGVDLGTLEEAYATYSAFVVGWQHHLNDENRITALREIAEVQRENYIDRGFLENDYEFDSYRFYGLFEQGRMMLGLIRSEFLTEFHRAFIQKLGDFADDTTPFEYHNRYVNVIKQIAENREITLPTNPELLFHEEFIVTLASMAGSADAEDDIGKLFPGYREAVSALTNGNTSDQNMRVRVDVQNDDDIVITIPSRFGHNRIGVVWVDLYLYNVNLVLESHEYELIDSLNYVSVPLVDGSGVAWRVGQRYNLHDLRVINFGPWIVRIAVTRSTEDRTITLRHHDVVPEYKIYLPLATTR